MKKKSMSSMMARRSLFQQELPDVINTGKGKLKLYTIYSPQTILKARA